MAFQSTVYTELPLGVVGELVVGAPIRSKTYVLNSSDASYNVFGRAFTSSADGVAVAGGTGAFAGIMIKPKAVVSYGTTAGGPLAPTLTAANALPVEMMTMGEVYVSLPAACAVGDFISYSTTTGALATVKAVGTATYAQSTTTLTVSAVSTGVFLGVGSVVQTSAGPTTIIALGTGTGGAGTYTVDTSRTVSSETKAVSSVPASGYALVPNAKVSRKALTGAGVGSIELTN